MPIRLQLPVTRREASRAEQQPGKHDGVWPEPQRQPHPAQ